MSPGHGLTPERVPAARASMRRFLRQTAPQAWAWQMRNSGEVGGGFYVPPQWVGLPVEEQARHLAHAEAERVAEATCWHLDSGCVQAVLREAGRSLKQDYHLDREDLPATAGLVVWAEHISPADYPAPVIAAHWRIEQDGVWTAWWTDKETSLPAMAQAHGVSIAQMRDALTDFGDLLYDRERLLPFGHGPALEVPPDPASEPAVRGMTAITLATWKLLRENRVTLRAVAESTFAASLPPGTSTSSVWT